MIPERQIEMYHAHPLLWAAVPLVAAIFNNSVFVVILWLLRKDAWLYHPSGAAGMLRDEAIRYGSIWLPFAVLLVAVRYYVYAFHPEYTQSPGLYVLYLSVFVFRRLARLLPHVKEIGARIDAARAAARAAKEAQAK
jgi:predicted metal-dependent hydrolase